MTVTTNRVALPGSGVRREYRRGEYIPYTGPRNVDRGYNYLQPRRPTFGRRMQPVGIPNRVGLSKIGRAAMRLRTPWQLGARALEALVYEMERSLEQSSATTRYSPAGSGWQLCGSCRDPYLTNPIGNGPINTQRVSGSIATALCTYANACLSGQAISGANQPPGTAIPNTARQILLGWQYSPGYYKVIETWTRPGTGPAKVSRRVSAPAPAPYEMPAGVPRYLPSLGGIRWAFPASYPGHPVPWRLRKAVTNERLQRGYSLGDYQYRPRLHPDLDMDIVIGPTLRPETRPTNHRDIPSPPALVRERKGRDSTGWTITKTYKRLVGVYDGLTEAEDSWRALSIP